MNVTERSFFSLFCYPSHPIALSEALMTVSDKNRFAPYGPL